MNRRTLIVAVLVVLAGLAGTVSVRGSRLRSRQPDVRPSPRVDVPAGAAERLAGALRWRTVSNADRTQFPADQFDSLHAYMERSWPRAHGVLKKEQLGESLIYTWQGSDPGLAPIVLMAHQDVVPVEPGTESRWTQGAFSGAIADGFVWGRGALDDKVNLAAEMEAVDMLAGAGFQPKRTVILSYGQDEEVGGADGAKRIAAELARRGVKAQLVLDEGGVVVNGALPGLEGAAALIGIAEKGYLSVELAVPNEGGHSSMPPDEPAVVVLAKALVRLQEHPMPARLDGATRAMLDYIGPEVGGAQRATFANLWLTEPLVKERMLKSPATAAMLRTTTAPTMLSGSPKDNVLPSRPTAVVNFRIMPGDDVAMVVRHVKDAVSDDRVQVHTLDTFSTDPSPVSDTASDAFRTLQRTIREVFPGVIAVPYLVVGGTDSRYYREISPSVFRFAPIRLQQSDLERVHGTDERIAVDAYSDGVRFYRQLLMELAG